MSFIMASIFGSNLNLYDHVNPITMAKPLISDGGKLRDERREIKGTIIEALPSMSTKVWKGLKITSLKTVKAYLYADEDEGEKHEQIIDKNVVELNNDVNKPVKTGDEPIRKATKEFLIGGLIENPRFNDSLLAMETGKMECEDYHSLPRISIRNAIMFKRVTRKMGMEGNFMIHDNIGEEQGI
ncbi:hypothetical protein Tco_1405999 [Tanacetum coccineum]